MTVRVVITGADLLTPIGTSWEATAAALQAGTSGIRPLTAFDSSCFPVHIAGEVVGWPLSDDAPRMRAMMERTAAGAIRRSGVPQSARHAIALAIGKPLVNVCRLLTDAGEHEEAVQDDYEALTLGLNERLDWDGPLFTFYTACASANDAIGAAMSLLRQQQVDVVLCGAADAQVSPLPMIELLGLQALAIPDAGDLRHPKPFDLRRRGLVLGEGAATFVLETLEHARKRGAPILGELLGYGNANDAWGLTRADPQGRGAARAMTAALADAKLAPSAIDYVNAHGTGTVLNDAIETMAMKRVFGSSAPQISSTKSMTGHLLAAAGAAELAFCLLALQESFVPPTINLDERDPQCDLDCVPNVARALKLRTIMSNSFGFGGQNASLIVGRFDD